MENMDKREWEFDPHEKYVIKSLEDLGFKVTIKKRYISKDKLVIEKDGWKYDAEIPLGQEGINYPRLMKSIVENWSMTKRLDAMRKEERA